MLERTSKGLKVHDRFTELVRNNPSRIDEIYDQHTKPKISMDIETSGKPNQLVSYFGIQDDLPLMASLSDMSSEEFVDTAEMLVNDQTNMAGPKMIK